MLQHAREVGRQGIEPLAATSHIKATGLQPVVRKTTHVWFSYLVETTNSRLVYLDTSTLRGPTAGQETSARSSRV